MFTVSRTPAPLLVNVKIGNKIVTMEADSGAAISVMSVDNFIKLNISDYTIRETYDTVRSVTGTKKNSQYFLCSNNSTYLYNNNSTYLYSALFTLCSNALLKKTVIPLLNTHRSYTEKMKVFSRFFNIVMESALWIFRGSSFHNLAAEVPKRRFPNRMDLFLYGTSDVNAVDRKDLLGM